MKIEKRRPGWSEKQIDEDSILLRAYGRGTDVLIDRERMSSRVVRVFAFVDTLLGEIRAHSVLASHRLAPPLLAHFENGLLYRFIQGTVCTPEDLRRPEIYRGVASRLGQWHAVLPITSIASKPNTSYVPSPVDSLLGERLSTDKAANGHDETTSKENSAPIPNVWGIMQKWIFALPTDTDAKQKRKDQLQSELEWAVKELADTPGTGGNPYVFSHCDLLSGNVIIMPDADKSAVMDGNSSASKPARPVSFIDYEYATPAPAAFDISNHFAEWAGFHCDHAAIPTKSQRTDFLRHYLLSYSAHANIQTTETDLDHLIEQVDQFRGIPGFYWGIWALIQALISQIDFDYASYAEIRLGEYWAWKDAEQRKSKAIGSGNKSKDTVEVEKEIPIRERRWAQE